jgi:hypothetical protein
MQKAVLLKGRENIDALRRHAQEERDDLVAEFEQKRRRIVKRLPLPGDQELTEYKDHLYTAEEYAKVRAFDEEHASPAAVANAYISKLLGDGTIEKANYLGVRDCNDPRAINPDGSPAPIQYPGGVKPRAACRKVWYQVRYVSRGGQILDRQGYVIVFVEAGYWYLIPTATYKLPDGSLVGLPLTFPDD